MNKICGCLLLTAVVGAAQNPPARPGVQQSQVVSGANTNAMNAPSPSQMYCAGFITKEHVRDDVRVVGGQHSPEATRFEAGTIVYLEGHDVEEGKTYQILRALSDPNEYEAFPGQRSLVRRTGQPYAEIGRVKVRAIRAKVAVADAEMTCGEIIPGDIAIPFVQKQSPFFRKAANFDMFAEPNGKPTGRMVMGKEFDNHLGFGNIVYLNIGSNEGVKVGDYLRAIRNYQQINSSPERSLAFMAKVTEDTQKHPSNFDIRRQSRDLPRLSLGEMIVIGVTPTTATGLVTLALEDLQVGDAVELEEEQPVVEQAAPSTAFTPAIAQAEAQAAQTVQAQPPTIYCSANPATVRVGESSTITCTATSPMDRQVTLHFSAPVGQLTPRMNRVTLDTTGLEPGPVVVNATATDEGGLSASAPTTVTVEAAPTVPVASKIAELNFKPNSSYVNNQAKAILDDIALRLQREPSTTVLLIGSATATEKPELNTQRATNAGTYLSKTKGIDAGRIQSKPAAQPDGNKVEVWIVPAGAPAPQ
jgi:outer membrane protein OmpA-like peptidoglycan-associated protein